MFIMAYLIMADSNFEQGSEQPLYLAAQMMVGCGGLCILGMGTPSMTNKICTVFESQGAMGLDATMLVRAGNC
jgi:hypothetical protein